MYTSILLRPIWFDITSKNTLLFYNVLILSNYKSPSWTNERKIKITSIIVSNDHDGISISIWNIVRNTKRLRHLKDRDNYK